MAKQTWYKVEKYKYGQIIEVPNVTRSTDVSVFLQEPQRECRYAKRSDWDNYFPTKLEAAKFLLARETSRRYNAKNQLQACEDALTSAERLFAEASNV